MPNLTHARHDPMHCLTPGLFRSLAPGDRKRLKLEVNYIIDDTHRIEFSGPEPLGVDDLRVLQGLIAMAGPHGARLGPEPLTEAGIEVRAKLEAKWDGERDDAIVVRGSFCELAREIGLSGCGGRHIEHLRECIERLWKCTIVIQENKTRRGFRMLAEYASDSHAGQLFVALNPLLTTAITGRRHTRIDMTEVRALTNDPARLLHQRLSAILPPCAARRGRFGIDTLCGYVWPGEANAEAVKKRRQSARKALTELASIGWHVSEYAKGKFEISRP